MNAIDLIKKYFGPRLTLPGTAVLASPEVLSHIAARIVPIATPLKLVGLVQRDRVSLSRKDQSDQRPRARAFLHLVQRRPGLAMRAGVQPDLYRAVIAKDESADLLTQTLYEFGEVIDDGLLQLAASISHQTLKVIRDVRDGLPQSGLSPGELLLIKVDFKVIDLSAVDHGARQGRASKEVGAAADGQAGPAGNKVKTKRKPPGRPLSLTRLFEGDAAAPGRPLPRGVLAGFAAFMAVPAETAVAVAEAIMDAAAPSGLVLLNREERNELSRQVDHAAYERSHEVLLALLRNRAVEQATGVAAAALSREMEQEVALAYLRRDIRLLKDLCDDSRRLLQAWLFEAERRLTVELIKDLTEKASPLPERQGLLLDAACVLDLIEERITRMRKDRQKLARRLADMEAQRLMIEEDTLMLKTVRNLREGRPVDPEVERRMALYYAGRAGTE